MRDINFNFLNFCTRYKSEGTVRHPMIDESCFSEIFRGPNKQVNEYEIEIYFNKHEDEDNNNCHLTTEQLVEFINEIKNVVYFEHALEKHEDKYVLKFKLDAPKIHHKLVLTWIRYCYEFPYNMIVEECFKLKNIHGFKRITFFNIFNIIGPSLNYSEHGTGIHVIGALWQFKKLISYKEIANKLKQAKYEAVNDLVDYLNINVGDFKYIKVPEGLEIEDSLYWDDETEFKNRIKVYKNNYKIIKEIK